MPVCLKCGYELVFGPAGCACTQAARRERQMEEAAKVGERLAETLAERAKNFSPEDLKRQKIQQERELLEARRDEIQHQQDLLQADWKALQRRCKHPKIREYSSMGELGKICDDCGYQD